MPGKDRQLNLRVSAAQRAKFERAAQLEGVTLSTLVLEAAEDRADDVLRARASTTVPTDVFDALLRALDEPTRDLAPALERALDDLPSIVDRR